MKNDGTLKEDIQQEQILQAALQLYMQYGLKKVTMDDVAKAIGKSRSSLYYYYTNRDEIYDAVMNAMIAEVIAEISAAIQKATSTKGKLRAFGLAKIKTSRDRQQLMSALETGMDASEISAHKTSVSRVHALLVREEAALLHKVLAVAMERGDIRKLKVAEVDTFVFLVQSSVRGVRRELQHKGDFSEVGAAMDLFAEMCMQWLGK